MQCFHWPGWFEIAKIWPPRAIRDLLRTLGVSAEYSDGRRSGVGASPTVESLRIRAFRTPPRDAVRRQKGEEKSDVDEAEHHSCRHGGRDARRFRRTCRCVHQEVRRWSRACRREGRRGRCRRRREGCEGRHEHRREDRGRRRRPSGRRRGRPGRRPSEAPWRSSRRSSEAP